MEYRNLGASGLRVSTISLGSWLTYGRSVDDGEANACLTRAYESGVNFFDTANVYATGAAEEALGRWIKGVPRSDLVIGTKAFFPMGEGPNDRGLSRKHLMEQCEASLSRLGVEYVDLYQCHRFDESVPLDETLRALDDLIAQGKVLYAGVSEWTAGQISDALAIQDRLGLRRLVSNQPQYSLLARRIEDEVLPLSRREGIGQVVWSPLAGGVLTGKYLPGQPPPTGSRGADPDSNMFMQRTMQNDVLEAVVRLREQVAEPLGVSVAELALAWALHTEGVTSVIVGASRPEQVDRNVSAAGLILDSSTIRRIEEIMAALSVVAQD
ncbi:MAG: aldo/keto reductase family protein [Gemmatimonadota bacterium]